MKRFGPLIREAALMTAATAIALSVRPHLPKPSLALEPRVVHPDPGLMIVNPASTAHWSKPILADALKAGTPVLFGSSELTFSGDTAVPKYFVGACGKPVVIVGRAGFQSSPMLATLAGLSEHLGPHTDLTFIVSPGWFAEHGTPTEAFLKYLEPRAVRELLTNAETTDHVREVLGRQIRLHRDELTGLYPDWLLAHVPLTGRRMKPRPPRATTEATRPADFDWDGAETHWRGKVAHHGKDNPYGVAREYWEKWKNRRQFPLTAPKVNPWSVEARDLLALSGFLRDHGVRARLIVQPMHRRIFEDVSAFDRALAEVEPRLRADGHHYVNYFKEPFDLALLEDPVHFSAYGWIKVQREMCRWPI